MTDERLPEREMYDETGESFDLPMVGVKSTGLIAINEGRYSNRDWYHMLYTKLGLDIWFPERFDLSEDAIEYKSLTPEYAYAYDRVIAFLNFLDSIQSYNPSNFARFVQASDINVLLIFQQFTEAIHAISYSYIIENVYQNKEKRRQIYDLWRGDPILHNRNKYIAKKYVDFEKNPTVRNFLIAVISNYILEGIYFYVGFIFFYKLESQNMMKGSANIIRLINRDEISHLLLFQNLIKELKSEHPEFFDEEMNEEILRLFEDAIESELSFSIPTFSKCIGFNEIHIRDYVYHLGYKRLSAIGFDDHTNPYVSHRDKNPYKTIQYDIEDYEKEAKGLVSTEENVFVSQSTSYNSSAVTRGMFDKVDDDDIFD